MAQTANRKGPGHGRFRKTVKSLFGDSRRSGLMPMSPAEAVSIGLAKQALQYQTRITRASLKAQNELAREQFKAEAHGIRAGARRDLSDVATSANDRGVLGSSINLQMEQQVKQERDSALQAAKTAQLQAQLGIKQGLLQNIADKRMGLAELALQTAATRAQGSLDIYGGPTRNAEDYQLDTSAANIGGGSPMGMTGVTPKDIGQKKVNRLTRKISGASSVEELTNKLNALGFSSPQGHHDEAATERDINVYKGAQAARGEGMTSPIEQRRLARLYYALLQAYGGPGGPLTELIFDPTGSYFGPGSLSKSPYGGHKAHLHFGFAAPSWGATGSGGGGSASKVL